MSLEEFEKYCQDYTEYISNCNNPIFFDHLNLYPINNLYKVAMISKYLVSNDIAKLLKKKGFKEKTYYYYFNNGELTNYGYVFNHNKFDSEYSAPSLQETHKWLKNKHHILVTVVPCEIKVGFQFLEYCIYDITETNFNPIYNYCPYKEGKIEYEDVMNEGIKYVLENLI